MRTDDRIYEAPTNYVCGERNHAAKLTEAQVVEIKRLLLRGAGYRFLAERYGVTKTTIASIAKNKSWRHVPWPPALVSRRER